jgi:hypothetical protein
MESRKPALWLLAGTELAWPRLSAPPCCTEAVGSQGRFHAAQNLSLGSRSSQSLVVQGKVSAARRAVEARTVRVWLVTGRQALAALHWASSSKKMYSGMSGVPL